MESALRSVVTAKDARCQAGFRRAERFPRRVTNGYREPNTEVLTWSTPFVSARALRHVRERFRPPTPSGYLVMEASGSRRVLSLQSFRTPLTCPVPLNQKGGIYARRTPKRWWVCSKKRIQKTHQHQPFKPWCPPSLLACAPRFRVRVCRVGVPTAVSLYFQSLPAMCLVRKHPPLLLSVRAQTFVQSPASSVPPPLQPNCPPLTHALPDTPISSHNRSYTR
jgi:hypothetical protein